jgi:hypothetical protein
VSKVIERHDVPGQETPLHVAVHLGDGDAVEMLMSTGADWSLQNEQGWSANVSQNPLFRHPGPQHVVPYL